MSRTFHFLRPAALAGVLFPIAVLACGGKGVTIGSNSGELRTVDPKTVAGSVPACAPQQAHPNVCCQGGPKQDSACVSFVNSPFHKCDDGWSTYPDPGTCCDLNDPNNCATLPPGPPPVGTCGYACAPGWWPVDNNPGECCILNPDGASLECAQSAWGGGDVPPTACAVTVSDDGGVAPDADPPPPIDAGPAPDAGVVDASPPPPPPPPGPPPIPDCDAGPPVPIPPPPPWPGPICNMPCPAGFTPLPNDSAVCCAPQPNGGQICFSQANGPAAGGVSGGGAPGSSGGGTGNSAGGAPVPPGK